MSDKDWEIAQLEKRIAYLRSTPEPTYHCAICGRGEDDLDEWPLTDVTVVVADGEEGYSNVTLLLCNDDLITITDGLTELGFVDHRHGSTSSLEDPGCPGLEDMDACPTPTHYGNVIWGKQPPQEPE